jgi:hypothetical protein
MEELVELCIFLLSGDAPPLSAKIFQFESTTPSRNRARKGESKWILRRE